MTLSTQRSRASRLLGSALLGFFLATVCPGVGWVPAALATARQDLERAQDLYDFAEFQQALELLTQMIDGGQLVGETKRDAYILRARCAVGLGLDAMARDDFCQVHELDPGWTPDPVVFPQDEIDLYASAEATCTVAAAEPAPAPREASGTGGKPWYAKPVFWAAGGAAILAAVLLGGGGDDETPTPTPSLPDLDGFPPPPSAR